MTTRTTYESSALNTVLAYCRTCNEAHLCDDTATECATLGHDMVGADTSPDVVCDLVEADLKELAKLRADEARRRAWWSSAEKLAVTDWKAASKVRWAIRYAEQKRPRLPGSFDRTVRDMLSDEHIAAAMIADRKVA